MDPPVDLSNENDENWHRINFKTPLEVASTTSIIYSRPDNYAANVFLFALLNSGLIYILCSRYATVGHVVNNIADILFHAMIGHELLLTTLSFELNLDMLMIYQRADRSKVTWFKS